MITASSGASRGRQRPSPEVLGAEVEAVEADVHGGVAARGRLAETVEPGDELLVNDGDLVLMQRDSSARDGDMVAAWLKKEEEATLKRFFRDGDRIRLQPANEAMAPIYTDADNVEVQGTVIGAIRPPR